jgi:hypothetical protein
MGRGLSSLQKRILTLVDERRQKRDFHESLPDTNHAELIGALFDWHLRRSWIRGDGLRPSEGAMTHYGVHNFDRGRVGVQEYNRRTASYYRAVKRLKSRGLLKTHRGGLLITDEGLRVVESYRLEELRCSTAGVS